jgi:hypothetical protein
MKYLGRIKMDFWCRYCEKDFENQWAEEREIEEQPVARKHCPRCGAMLVRYTRINQKNDPYFRESKKVKTDIKENGAWFIEQMKKNQSIYWAYEKWKEENEKKLILKKREKDEFYKKVY